MGTSRRSASIMNNVCTVQETMQSPLAPPQKTSIAPPVGLLPPIPAPITAVVPYLLDTPQASTPISLRMPCPISQFSIKPGLLPSPQCPPHPLVPPPSGHATHRFSPSVDPPPYTLWVQLSCQPPQTPLSSLFPRFPPLPLQPWLGRCSF